MSCACDRFAPPPEPPAPLLVQAAWKQIALDLFGDLHKLLEGIGGDNDEQARDAARQTGWEAYERAEEIMELLTRSVGEVWYS